MCTIMVSGSADGALECYPPFFDVRVWPLSAIDLSSSMGQLCFYYTPANGDGL